jgi:hypothetical protein
VALRLHAHRRDSGCCGLDTRRRRDGTRWERERRGGTSDGRGRLRGRVRTKGVTSQGAECRGVRDAEPRERASGSSRRGPISQGAGRRAVGGAECRGVQGAVSGVRVNCSTSRGPNRQDACHRALGDAERWSVEGVASGVRANGSTRQGPTVLRVRVLLSSVGSSRDEHAASSIRPCKRESIATIRVRNDRRDVVESDRRYLPLYLRVK